MADNTYTLLIPTYNRSRSVASLLRYLDALNAPFRISVLDSGTQDSRTQNKKCIDSLSLRCEYFEYPEETHPFDKFRMGVEAVQTPLCGFCADDDILLIDALQETITFLEDNSDYHVAHGYYFQFADRSDRLDVATMTYYTPSYDMEDPLERLHALMRHYQALTYGTYRTQTLARIFNLTRPVTSILARELLSSALATLHGKVARLPVIFHGRNLGPSSSYSNWHPLEWLMTDAPGLFAEYMGYRDILLKELDHLGSSSRSPRDAARIVDLIHAQYLIRHAPDECFDHIIGRTMAGEAPKQVFGSSPVSHALIRAAHEYSGLQAPDPSAPPGEPVALRRYLARIESMNPSLVRIARSAVRKSRAWTGRTSDGRSAAPAPVPAKAADSGTGNGTGTGNGADDTGFDTSRPIVKTSPVRSYRFAPAFLQTAPHWNVVVDNNTLDAMISSLDRYQ